MKEIQFAPFRLLDMQTLEEIFTRDRNACSLCGNDGELVFAIELEIPVQPISLVDSCVSLCDECCHKYDNSPRERQIFASRLGADRLRQMVFEGKKFFYVDNTESVSEQSNMTSVIQGFEL